MGMSKRQVFKLQYSLVYSVSIWWYLGPIRLLDGWVKRPSFEIAIRPIDRASNSAIDKATNRAIFLVMDAKRESWNVPRPPGTSPTPPRTYHATKDSFAIDSGVTMIVTVFRFCQCLLTRA